ncbi:MAG TPA: pectate lyase [Prolixibacteraceae bacterium]|nr:pectate lyase [Prolixibacteraceae bacterium]
MTRIADFRTFRTASFLFLLPAKRYFLLVVQLFRKYLTGLIISNEQRVIIRFLHIALFLFSTVLVYGQTVNLPAFPGAEGFGKYATGGRGGAVIYVTTMDDHSSPGSLRYAVALTGARIVLFKVSGTIKLKSALKITNGNLTIAGQTAPGDGICIRDYPVEVSADNVVIRFIRFRMGDETQQENDALWGRNHKNILIDHCSVSWSTDECSSFYDNENFTMQWCIVSESLRNSVHGKGAHGYGGIWGGKNASFHHNLLAGHDSRNPRFCGSRYSNNAAAELVDFRNNVIYNWGSNTTYGAEGGNYNMVNNYYKAGPATSSSSKFRILQPYADDGTNSQKAGIYGKFYVSGNYVSGSSAVSNDNWQGVSLHSSFGSYAAGVTKNDIKAETAFLFATVTTHDAPVAYENVLAYAGTSLKRDTVDRRIIHDTRTGTATFMTGGNGSSNGIIDTQSAVGGWPELKSADAPLDTDADGMPDTWEDAKGLNKNSASDAQLKTVDGEYPNVEVYINSLVSGIIENQNKGGVITFASGLTKSKNQAELFYNHSSGELNIHHENAIENVQIYSLTGSVMKAIHGGGSKQLKIRLGELPDGIYLVRIQDEQNKVFSAKVVK